MGAATADQILQVDPQAFYYVPGAVAQHSAAQTATAVPQNGAPATNGALATDGAATTATAPTEAGQNVGLGQGDAVAMDNSGVVFEGETIGEDDPVAGATVRFCNELLIIAVARGASDMHLEPRTEGLLPRYRIDGHLLAGGLIPRELQPSITSRFKVLANLDISENRLPQDGRLGGTGVSARVWRPSCASRFKVLANLDSSENRLPQDGRFRATVGGHVFDFRVSTLPSIHGEKIVMRLLN